MSESGRRPETAFSTPFDAPLVPDLPFAFRDVWILTALYRSEAEAIAGVVPEPLAPDGDLVAVHIYRMGDTDWFGAYNESAVQVQVVHARSGRRGAYSPYLFLDHEGAIAAGREVYGQPKKLGQPRIEVRGDLVVGEVRRNDIACVTITTPYKQRRCELSDALARFDFVTNVNLKVIPAVDGGAAIRQITARRLQDVRIHECWRAPATVELRPNAQAPVHRLPVREMLEAFYWRCDFTLGFGEVWYDDLA